MKKRILSILLCLVLCLSLMPTVAFAADPVKITEVAVTGVPTPVVGASTAISASDVTITTDPADAATINEIYWNTLDETFQADKSYKLIVRFAPKTGYYFEFEDETGVEYYTGDVTFNGQPAFSAYESGSVPGELFATSQSMTPTEAPTPVKITEVAVTGVPTPVVGASTAISASDVTITTEPADAFTVDAIVWYNNSTDSIIDPVFAAGDSYSLEIRLIPKEGYYFEFDSADYYTGEATFNGQPAYSAGEDLIAGALYTYSNFMKPAEPELIPITEVEVTGVPTPVVDASTDTSGITITTVPADSTNVYDIFWYNYTDSTDTDTTFKANCEYFLNVKLTNKDGYYFEFDNSEQEYYLGQATVNGEEPEIAWSFGYDELAIMSKHMKPVALEKITKVEIQVTEPVDGETPDTAVTVVTTPEGAATVFEDLGWFDENDDPATVFEEGKFYYCWLSLAPKDGYEFEFEDGIGITDYCGTALVNGEEANYAESRSRYLTYLFIQQEFSAKAKPVAPEKITKVEVQVTEPVDGETPDTAAVVVTTPEGAATVFEVPEWYDDDDNAVTVFEEGKDYYCWLSLAPKDGYVFEFEAGTGITDYCGTALVNGEEAIVAESRAGYPTYLYVDQKFTAKAKPATYTVSFDMGGHGTQVAEQPVEDGGKATKPADPTAEGWTFGGWYADATFSTKFDFNTAITANTTIYAKWTENTTPPAPTYTIIAGMGGEWTKGSMAGLSFTSDAPFAKFDSVQVDGSTIAAANYTAEEGSTKITLAPAYLETLSIGSHSIVVVSTDGTASTNFTVKAAAQPPVPAKYTVSFNMNGHGTQITAQTVESGSKATKPADPTAEGWTFGGWYADATFNVAFDFNTAINADTTVYAKWTENTAPQPPVPEKFTVSFNMNGHGTQVAEQTVEDGSKATKPADPTASGYTFGGWYADATFSAKFDFNTAITANTTVYAKWTKNSVAPTDPTSPQTGDNSHMFLWIALLFVSGGALVGTTVYGKKRKRAE